MKIGILHPFYGKLLGNYLTFTGRYYLQHMKERGNHILTQQQRKLKLPRVCFRLDDRLVQN